MKITVDKETSLLEALELLAPDSSKTTLRGWLKENRVTVDDKPAKIASMMVEPGQTVAVGTKKKFLDHELLIVHEDDGFVVVDKPPGLLSVPTETEKELTAYAILKKYYAPRKVNIIHRLDRDTSGVMIFGLGEKSYKELKKLFETHDIERRYRAVVEGIMKKTEGTWRSHIFEDANFMMHVTANAKKGKIAITHYKVVGKSKRHTMLDLTLMTGRKNQIRVQCQAAGHPVAGDGKYGATSNPINRLCLHAYHLAFIPPGKKRMMRFQSPLPEMMRRVVDA